LAGISISDNVAGGDDLWSISAVSGIVVIGSREGVPQGVGMNSTFDACLGSKSR